MLIRSYVRKKEEQKTSLIIIIHDPICYNYTCFICPLQLCPPFSDFHNNFYSIRFDSICLLIKHFLFGIEWFLFFTLVFLFSFIFFCGVPLFSYYLCVDIFDLINLIVICTYFFIIRISVWRAIVYFEWLNRFEYTEREKEVIFAWAPAVGQTHCWYIRDNNKSNVWTLNVFGDLNGITDKLVECQRITPINIFKYKERKVHPVIFTKIQMIFGLWFYWSLHCVI